MPTTVVVNMNGGDHTRYIGRKHDGSMHYGNPFSHNPKWGIACDNRKESIDNYRLWLAGNSFSDLEPERRMWILRNVENLRGHRLGCYCKPLPCHGDILVEVLGD